MLHRTDCAPGLDVTGLTISACKFQSRDCPFCSGIGLATIFNPRYEGSPVLYEFDDQCGEKSKVMRSVAYCVCTAGVKVLTIHQAHAKDVYHCIPELNDVLYERLPNWVADDPTARELTVSEEQKLPDGLRAQIERIRQREYPE